MEMERGGSAGFHGYRKPPTPPLPTSSGTELPEINMSLSDINTTKKNDDTNNDINSVANNDNECTVREQDRFMPIANVIRIMRKILPPHAKISDDAKETIQECVSEYISFITGEANERCQLEQRKTITAEDVLWAMSKLGFDDYIEPLTLYLNRYREFEGDRGAIRGEPLVKRAVDPNAGAFNMAAFAPIGGFHYHHQGGGGFLGAPPPPPMGGFLKDAPNMASSSQAGASLDQGPYLQGNKL